MTLFCLFCNFSVTEKKRACLGLYDKEPKRIVLFYEAVRDIRKSVRTTDDGDKAGIIKPTILTH